MKTNVKAGRITEKDFIKGINKGSREAEIEMYGKPICLHHTFKNKKKYTRKQKYKGVNDDSF